MKKAILRTILAGAMAAGLTSTALAQQGVSDSEVVIGSNGDLSGIFAPFNVQAIKAAQMRFDQVNEEGGIHGRKIKFVTEDHGYQLSKAQANFNKLVNSDKVFAMILNLGTPMNLAGYRIMDPAKVANVSPLTSAKALLEQPDPQGLHYLGGSTYYDHMKSGIEYLAENEGAKNICAMYIPSDFGKEIQEGAKAKTEELGLSWTAETTHKPDEQEFVGALTKLRQAGCDTIALALGVRQIIITLGTAKKLGWDDVNFLGSSAGFHEAIASQPFADGYYAAAAWADYKPRMDKPEVKEWYDAYKAKYNEEPGMAAILGFGAAETVINALENAGEDLTPKSFRKGMESIDTYDPIGDVKVNYGPDDHKGGDVIVINRVEGGQFKEVSRLNDEGTGGDAMAGDDKSADGESAMKEGEKKEESAN